METQVAVAHIGDRAAPWRPLTTTKYMSQHIHTKSPSAIPLRLWFHFVMPWTTTGGSVSPRLCLSTLASQPTTNNNDASQRLAHNIKWAQIIQLVHNYAFLPCLLVRFKGGCVGGEYTGCMQGGIVRRDGL